MQVSGLQTDSCYWFSVAAHNAAGASNASHTSDSSSCTVSGLSSGELPRLSFCVVCGGVYVCMRVCMLSTLTIYGIPLCMLSIFTVV